MSYIAVHLGLRWLLYEHFAKIILCLNVGKQKLSGPGSRILSSAADIMKSVWGEFHFCLSMDHLVPAYCEA